MLATDAADSPFPENALPDPDALLPVNRDVPKASPPDKEQRLSLHERIDAAVKQQILANFKTASRLAIEFRPAVHHHQALQQRGVTQRQMQTDNAAKRVADEVATANIQLIEQASQLIRHILHAITGRYHALTAAGAELVVDHHTKMFG